MGYLSIIGEENLKNCFSAKQVTVLNNKKTERKLYVVTNKDELPNKPFKNDLFETIFYFATDEITEKVEGEFFGGFAPIFFTDFLEVSKEITKKHLETSKTFIQKK